MSFADHPPLAERRARPAAHRHAGTVLAGLAVAALLGGAGCSNPSAKPDAKTPAVNGNNGKGCAANATKSTDGGFCLTLPASMKAKDPFDKNESSREYDYKDDNGKSLTVVVTKMDDPSKWDSEVQVRTDEANKPTNKDKQVTDLPGGGKFMSWVEEDGSMWVTTLAHNDAKLFFCRTSGRPADPELVDACKSMRPL
jgi:hypothetical protein